MAPEQLAAELSAYCFAGPKHITGGVDFTGLFGWEDLSRLLTLEGSLGPEGTHVRLVQHGADIPREEYIEFTPIKPGAVNCRLRFDVLKRAYEEGATLMLFRIDLLNPTLSQLCRRMEDTLGCMVHVQCFAACRDEPSFPHSDPSSVVALQMSGRKLWKVEGYPDVMLNTGDALFLPEGWPHHVFPVGEPSLHLAVSISKRISLPLLVSSESVLGPYPVAIAQ